MLRVRQLGRQRGRQSSKTGADDDEVGAFMFVFIRRRHLRVCRPFSLWASLNVRVSALGITSWFVPISVSCSQVRLYFV